MAQGDIVFYNTAKKHLSDSPINWDTDTIKCELMLAAYTPNIDTKYKIANKITTTLRTLERTFYLHVLELYI